MAFLSEAQRALNWLTTVLASEPQLCPEVEGRKRWPLTVKPSDADTLKQTVASLKCAWMACSRLVARPSCRKNSRCPIPQRGAVRNSSAPASPWLTPSANVAPMWCRAKSEKGENDLLFRPTMLDVPEVSVCE